MANTIVSGTYVAPTATNLTQSVTRIGSITEFTPIVLTTHQNYSKSYTATFTISSTDAASVNIGLKDVVGYTVPRVGNVCTLSSNSTTGGITVNNWALFKANLQRLTVITTGTVWPNPAFTIAVSLTDGTTTLSGTVSLSSLAESATPPTVTLLTTERSTASITWTGAGAVPGISTYKIYRNGVYHTSTTSTSFTESISPTDVYSYYVTTVTTSGAVESAASNTVTIGFTYFLTSGSPIKYTTDLTSYSNANININETLIPYSNSTTLMTAIGTSSASIYKSTDGITWSPTTVPTAAYGNMAFANNVYVLARADTGASVITSADSNTWTSRSTGISLVNAISFGHGPILNSSNNRFFLLGSTALLSSIDGVTWSSFAITGSTFNLPVYGDGKWLLMNNNGTESSTYYTSTDGINWTSRSLPAAMYSSRVVYANSLFVFAGKFNNNVTKICSSSDGITWNVTTLTADDTEKYEYAEYHNSRFYLRSQGQKILTSTTGQHNSFSAVTKTWTDFSGPARGPMIYRNGKWAFIDTQGDTYYSTDGTTWNYINSVAIYTTFNLF